MSELENVCTIIEKTVAQFDKNFQQKLVRHSVFHRWKDIAANLAEDIFPIKIVDDTLILYSKSASAKDNMKYMAKDIIDSANAKLGGGAEVFKNIDFAKTYHKPKNLASNAHKKTPQVEVAQIELTAEELLECQKNVADIKNPEVREVALKGFINLKKTEKLKIQNGWHKCKICSALIAAEEIICEVCRIGERNKMRREIRQTFYKNPDTKFYDLLKVMKNKFPHIAEEISIETVESERSSLIAETAKKISFGDSKSDAAKFLVMLYRGLPKEKLTDAIINHTLAELRFNLSDQLPFETKTFKKFSKNSDRKSAAN